MDKRKIGLKRLDGGIYYYTRDSFRNILQVDARRVLSEISGEELDRITEEFSERLYASEQSFFTNEEWKSILKDVMAQDYPEVYNSFVMSNKDESIANYDEICSEVYRIERNGDNSNGSVDSSLSSSKRALTVDALQKVLYRNYYLTKEQKAAFDKGYIYIHDMGHRLDSINCCLFDMEKVLTDGFEMGEMWYNEPESLAEAFDVIGSVSLNAAAQIYGGFTIPEIDRLLVKYAYKSFNNRMEKYRALGIPEENAAQIADSEIKKDFADGFFSLEEKFNSIISPRGDYPFITITFGLGKDKYAQMATEAALEVRRNGHGAPGFKRPVLFPKLVFLFDENLHKDGKELNRLFKCAIECSSKVMYPEYLSLTGEKGIVSEVYKAYGEVISPMCCRAFLTKWFEKGGENPADKDDKPVFVGRFNFGVVSLNIPMILAKSRRDNTGFYEELDYYLELARQIHLSTYKFLSRKKAYTNPLCFMQGGLYGGTLNRDDTIEPLLKSATASFGFTALNEVQRLYNGKSLAEDGQFALEVLKYINEKVISFTREDHIQYSVYGTPAESLCGRQAGKFKEEFGVIKDVSDREYFSNSFHCHVSEDINPIEKQELEARFWDLANGGKIQYIRFTAPHNTKALESIVLHAMDLGLYEGINMSLAFCNSCGHEWKELEHDKSVKCPACKSSEITMIERMCGYIAFTRIHGQSRLNEAKMAEIADRVSM